MSYCDPIIPEGIFIPDNNIMDFYHVFPDILDTFLIYNHKPLLHKAIDNEDPTKESDTLFNIKSCASLCYTWKE